MHLRELTIEEFSAFSNRNELNNYMQTVEYARLMGEYHFNYDYIGLVDDANRIVAASLILYKKIGFNMKYGYAPKGFLINYYDENLLKTFVEELKKFYTKKNVAFIKINPEIVVASVDTKTHKIESNENMRLKAILQNCGFTKLKDNMYFESIEPRFNAYIDLKRTDYSAFSKTNRNKVNNAKRKGLYLETANIDLLESFYPLLDTKKDITYYNHLFNLYSSSIELVLVRVNFEEYIKNCQALYDKELNNNGLLQEIIHRSHKTSDLNAKMSSDSKLLTLKDEIIYATNGLRDHNGIIVAGAIVIKHKNRVHIVESAFDKNYKRLNANYYLYNAIIDKYKVEADYLDIGGVVGDFDGENPYSGLNRFKLGFNPNVYEYIGEFDLVLNKMNYDWLLSSGKLAQAFNKSGK